MAQQPNKIRIHYTRAKRQFDYEEVVDAEVVSEPARPKRSASQTINMLFKLNTSNASRVIKRHQQAHANIRSLKFKK